MLQKIKATLLWKSYKKGVKGLGIQKQSKKFWCTFLCTRMFGIFERKEGVLNQIQTGFGHILPKYSLNFDAQNCSKSSKVNYVKNCLPEVPKFFGCGVKCFGKHKVTTKKISQTPHAEI